MRKPTILLAEDDDDMVVLLRFLLEREGYEVFVANDGRQAVHFIEQIEPPKVVLLDIMLPYIDGLQLVTQIRDKSTWGKIPIIILTANSTEHSVVRALNAGANDYVVKPFNPKELLARLRRFLPLS